MHMEVDYGTNMANSKQNRTRLTETLLRHGWSRDKWGHFKKEMGVTNRGTGLRSTKLVRIRLKALSCKIEIQQTTLGVNVWVPRLGGFSYFKNLKFLPDGRVKIGSIKVGKPIPEPDPQEPDLGALKRMPVIEKAASPDAAPRVSLATFLKDF